jgi:aspartyl-tRNA(Asn)/glutamyl-tRNA(Gln) amidotransferase subunit A
VSIEASVRETLTQAHDWQRWLNCFVDIDDEGAMERARDLDASGRAVSSGSIVGLPVAYKDVFVRRDHFPSAGSAVDLRDEVGEVSPVETALRRAGTVDIGSLHLDEFSYAATGRSDVLGDCSNPWDITRATGGSSSGAAAAVAARILPLAIGTDTGGSMRIPAAWCGVVGFKPTFSSISTRGIIPLSPSHDTVALVALETTVLRAALGELRISRRFPQAQPGAACEGLRVGQVVADSIADTDDDVRRGMSMATGLFESLGSTVMMVEVPELHLANVAAAIVTATEAAAMHHGLLLAQPGRYQAGTRTRLRAGSLVNGIDYIDSLRYRARAIRAVVARTFASSDVLITPVAPSAALRLSDLSSPSDPSMGRGTGSLLNFTRPFNYLGFPAISIPVGFSEGGLPLAVQVVAAPGNDHLLVDIAESFEKAVRWTEHRPEIPQGAGAGSAGGIA